MTGRGRVLIATDTMMPGGVDRYILDLAAAAREAGYEVSVLLERSSGEALGSALEEIGVEVHRRRLYHRSYDEELIARECRGLLRETAPALLHVVCGIPWSCLTLRETAADLGIATVVTEQYVPEELELSPAAGARIESLYGRSRQVVFVCEGNRDEMGRRVQFDRGRTRVIPNAVQVGAIGARCPSPRARLERAKARRAAGSLRAMTAARLTPQKGIDLLIEALGSLGGETGMRVDLYGDGPERERLEARCRELGLDDSVRFHGWCRDVVGELAEHDLFLLPSRNEGMPYTLLEAMAGGIPVIAAAVPGIVEALDGGRLGRVVPRNDPGALAGALASWLDGMEASFEVAEDATRHAASRHDLSGCMARTLACWAAPA